MTAAREDRLFRALTVARGLTPEQLLVHFPAENGIPAEACATGSGASAGPLCGARGRAGCVCAAQEAVSDIGSYWFGQREAVRDHNRERGAA